MRSRDPNQEELVEQCLDTCKSATEKTAECVESCCSIVLQGSGSRSRDRYESEISAGPGGVAVETTTTDSRVGKLLIIASIISALVILLYYFQFHGI